MIATVAALVVVAGAGLTAPATASVGRVSGASHQPPKPKQTGGRRFADGVWQGTAHGGGSYGYSTPGVRTTVTCNNTAETFTFRFTLKRGVVTGGSMNGQATVTCDLMSSATSVGLDGEVTLTATLSGTAGLVTGTGEESVNAVERLSVNGVSGPPTPLTFTRSGIGHFAATGGSCKHMTGDVTVMQSQAVNTTPGGGFSFVRAPFDATRLSGPACR